MIRLEIKIVMKLPYGNFSTELQHGNVKYEWLIKTDER